MCEKCSGFSHKSHHCLYLDQRKKVAAVFISKAGKKNLLETSRSSWRQISPSKWVKWPSLKFWLCLHYFVSRGIWAEFSKISQLPTSKEMMQWLPPAASPILMPDFLTPQNSQRMLIHFTLWELLIFYPQIFHFTLCGFYEDVFPRSMSSFHGALQESSPRLWGPVFASENSLENYRQE